MVKCFLWHHTAASQLFKDSDEILVSSVIELSCDDPLDRQFSEVTVALSHSAEDVRGYETVMKQLSRNQTWEDLETTKIMHTSGTLLFNSDRAF